MITWPSSLEARHLDRADSTTELRCLPSQKFGPSWVSKSAGSALLKKLTRARCAATVVAVGYHQLITPSPHLSRLPAPCPRRAHTSGDSRPIAGSSGCPSPAQSSGPPRWITLIKLVPKLTVRVRFPSPAPHAKSVAAEPYSRLLVPFLTGVSVLARATSGHTYPHLGTHPPASEDAQLVPSCSPAVRLPGLPTSPGECLRKLELDADGLSCNAAKKHHQ